MKAVNAAVSSAIRSAYDVTALPKVTADWNFNRYYDTKVTNTPSEDTDGNDVEMFPIESIVEPVRPTKGIAKARVGQSKISGSYIDPNDARFYVASVSDKYKYWQNPTVSDASGNITGCQPTVLYGSWNSDKTVFTNASVTSNKIVVKLENSWATPVNFTVETTVNGTTWTTAATNPTINNDGSIVLYWNGTGYSSNKPATLTATRTIQGVRLNVTKLGAGQRRDGVTTSYNVDAVTYNTTGANSFFSLIELGLHWEVDLTRYVINVEDTFDTSDVSMLYPIGSLTTNTAGLTLWNGDSEDPLGSNIFNKDNALSPFSNLLEANVEINLEYIYKIGGTDYSVQQFKMYSQAWTGQKGPTVSVPLGDYSNYFQEVNPNPAMYENLTLPEILYRLCDAVGFVDYQIASHPELVDYVIPVYYVDGEQTLWQELDELAKATQSAIYFDGFGKLQVRTREAAFDKNRVSDWTLRAVTVGTELADIVQDGFSQDEEFENNVVKVTYQTTKWSDWNNGLPSMTNVWQPEDTAVVRASMIQAAIPATQAVAGSNQYIKLTSVDASTWPYKGLMNVEGEIIRYEGKRFVYYTGTTGQTYNIATVFDEAEHKKLNESTPEGYRIKNYFDGNLVVKTGGRGEWNSEMVAHTIDASGYGTHGYNWGNYRAVCPGLRHNKTKSSVTLYPNGRMTKPADIFVMSRGTTSDAAMGLYGTKIRFDAGKTLTHQIAGMVLNNAGTGEAGYYIDLMPTGKMTAAMRANRNELIVYTRTGGVDKRVGGRGTAVNIAQGVDYEIDIKLSSSHLLQVYINGLLMFSQSVPVAQRQTLQGKFGLFIRGKSQITADYLYGIARATADIPDDFSYFDKIEGGYVGGLFTREWTYNWRTATRRVKKKNVKYQQRWNQMFMDEFGPIAHEIREYDVKFDPKPVLYSRLYQTNDWDAACLEYNSTPFGAKFVIANTARQNAVIHGSETLNYAGSSKDIEHQLTVIGRAQVLSDAETVEARNEQQIRARGAIETTLESPWIQSKEAAEGLAEWIKQHWSSGIDGASVTIFGNPLIEVGDLVTVEYPNKNMTGVRYFVTGTSNKFETGLETTLTLRRVSPVV